MNFQAGEQKRFEILCDSDDTVKRRNTKLRPKYCDWYLVVDPQNYIENSNINLKDNAH